LINNIFFLLTLALGEEGEKKDERKITSDVLCEKINEKVKAGVFKRSFLLQ
jgi:hypothetical protein